MRIAAGVVRNVVMFSTLSAGFLLAATGSAAAQAGTAAAALTGTVRDPSGAVLPGASIVLSNTKTGIKQESASNATGNYRIANVTPGTYTVSVLKSGFATANSVAFDLSVNQTANLNFMLQLGTAASRIDV